MIPELTRRGAARVGLTDAGPDAPRPTALAERTLAPDLARGIMLLLIALANSHYFLVAPALLGGYPEGGGPLDAALTWVLATFVDGRAFPFFGLMFGYGVAQLVRRHEALGPGQVRAMLRRRALTLGVVGLLHGLLLYVGDILAAYGVLLFLGAWTVRWRDRWLLVVATAVLLLTALPGPDSSSVSRDAPGLAMLPTDPLVMLLERAQVTWWIALLGPVGVVCPFLVGVWAGRRRVLDTPQQHRALLVGTAVLGTTAALLGAQPVSLVLAGVVPLPPPATLEVIGPLHDATGVLGGFGYAALLALAAARLTTPPPAGPVTRSQAILRAVVATGQRSMTCYLAQSVVWSLVFTPFLLDLAGTLTVAGTALLAMATWALTVVLADRMRATGRRGPFETLVRRVTYGAPTPPEQGAGTPDDGRGRRHQRLMPGASRHPPRQDPGKAPP